MLKHTTLISERPSDQQDSDLRGSDKDKDPLIWSRNIIIISTQRLLIRSKASSPFVPLWQMSVWGYTHNIYPQQTLLNIRSPTFRRSLPTQRLKCSVTFSGLIRLLDCLLDVFGSSMSWQESEEEQRAAKSDKWSDTYSHLPCCDGFLNLPYLSIWYLFKTPPSLDFMWLSVHSWKSRC